MDEFPIRVLEELTGVPATTLRAWERRYGLLHPKRSPSGHRLYNQQDVTRVREVLQWLRAKVPIREAAKRVKNAIKPSEVHEFQGPWNDFTERLLQAIENFHDSKIDAIYNECISLYPMDLVASMLIEPILQTLGERWATRPAGIAEEHFFAAYLRNKLGTRLHHESQRPRGRRLLVSGLPGDAHEIGLLMFALAALGRGYRVLYLGPDLPFAQIAQVQKRTEIAGVVVTGILDRPLSSAIAEELVQLVRDCPAPILVGGNFAVQHEHWVRAQGAYALPGSIIDSLGQIERILPAYGRPLHEASL